MERDDDDDELGTLSNSVGSEDETLVQDVGIDILLDLDLDEDGDEVEEVLESVILSREGDDERDGMSLDDVLLQLLTLPDGALLLLEEGARLLLLYIASNWLSIPNCACVWDCSSRD